MVKKPALSASPDQKAPIQTDNNSVQSLYQSNLFLKLALEMTWQLALVVIVPIVGGYLLDKHFSSSPWLTLVGFALAAFGVFAVLHRIVSQAGARSGYNRLGDKK